MHFECIVSLFLFDNDIRVSLLSKIIRFFDQYWLWNDLIIYAVSNIWLESAKYGIFGVGVKQAVCSVNYIL